MNMLEAMAVRRSTRSFSGEGLSAAEAGELSGMLASVGAGVGPFGHRVRLVLYADEERGGVVRLGTYGLISGASAYIVPAAAPGAGVGEDVGWIVEKAVLEATAMGWASCWIGGVFGRGKAARIAEAAPGEFVPAVIAIGKPATKRSFADRFVTGAADSRRRKALGEIVFGTDGEPLGETRLAEPWLGEAAALQGAPSASNRQPWRLARLPSGDEWLIFMDEDKVYNNSLGNTHLQNIDLGIGMRHFAEAALALGVKGRWSPIAEFADSIDTVEGLRAALGWGERKGWIPIALWR